MGVCASAGIGRCWSRRAEPKILSEIALRNGQFTEFAAPDFAELGHNDSTASARLWILMVTELAVAESVAGGVRADPRWALDDFLQPDGAGLR